MSLSDATIKITDLRLRTYIGFNPEELTRLQDVVINIQISYPASLAMETDNESNALNYKTVTKEVIALVEEGRFRLLEKLVADILEVSTKHPWTTYARVTVDKPHALRFADSVSLSLEWRKDLQL